MPKRHSGIAWGAAAALLISRPVSAQTPCLSADASEEAEARGMALNQSGDHDGAYASFARSYELCRGARALARMAIARMASGRWPEADGWMRRALSQRDDAWVEAHREVLEQQFAIIAGHVGELMVTGEGSGEVRVDGRRVADFPMRVPVGVAPGVVTVRVNTSDGRQFERAEQVAVGQRTRVEVTWPRPAVAPARASSLQVVLAGVSAGVGVAAFIVGAWATSERFDRRAAYDAQCPPGHPIERLDDCSALLARVSDTPVVASQAAGFAVGGALAIVASVLFATAPSRGRASQTIACSPGPGAVGLGCSVRF